ncbi:MAG: hypothetical protein M3374_05335 [Pseudomonadota bacterium]|nr:hypothetical protein [Pseudomonadota bacterium]
MLLLGTLVMCASGCASLFPVEADNDLAHFVIQAPGVGEAAPELQARRLDGTRVQLSDILDGKRPVVRENRCDYCVAHHREALARYVSDADLLDAICRGAQAPELVPADRELMAYAAKLTRTPSAVSIGDIQRLRDCGLAEADILLANLIVAYFNFVNRIALGLGAFSEAEVAGYQV